MNKIILIMAALFISLSFVSAECADGIYPCDENIPNVLRSPATTASTTYINNTNITNVNNNYYTTGGNPFDQWLNTTNDVTHANMTLNSNDLARLLVYATDGNKNSGVIVIDGNAGYGSMQGASSIEGLNYNSGTGVWSYGGSVYLNYFNSTGGTLYGGGFTGISMAGGDTGIGGAGTINFNSIGQKGLSLYGASSATGNSRRGGFLEWYYGDELETSISRGVTYVNNQSKIVFEVLKQSSANDVGNAWIGLNTGDASFKNMNATEIRLSGNKIGNLTTLWSFQELNSTTNPVYDTWLPNYTAYNKYWYNMTLPQTSTTYYPRNITFTGGTIEGANNVTLAYYYDGLSYNITEGNGVDPLDVYINYTGVTTFNQLVMREYYLGSSSHNIQIQFYDYNTNSWESYYDFVGQAGFTWITIPVFDPTAHLQNGNVSMRLHHIENGFNTHKLYIDVAWLVSGNNIGASTNLEGYAKYNFGSNNFNGTGNITTTGRISGGGSSGITFNSTCIRLQGTTSYELIC